jgi:predicted protein tyrosine phosphatase
MVIVTSYSLAQQRAAQIDPLLVISLMDPGSTYSMPCGPSLERHIRIDMHDIRTDEIEYPAPYVMPTATHIRQIIDIATAWHGNGQMLIHCAAGVSRSAAAGLIVLAARNPGREAEIARLLRQRGPWTDPNRLMIRLADDHLVRRGALVDALDKMGEPRMRGVVEPVLLPCII